MRFLKVPQGLPSMDKFWMWLAGKLPRKLTYWSAIRLWAHATRGPYSSEEATGITFDVALKRWEENA